MEHTIRAPAGPLPPDGAPRRGPWFEHPWKWPLRLMAAVLLALCAVWLVLFITKGRFLRPTFERLASSEAGRPVRVAGDFNLYFNPLNIAFKADGITVANPAWAHANQLFTAQHFALSLRTIPLVFGRREIAWIDLANAAIAPEWDAHHKANTWTFDLTGKPLEIPEIDTGTVTGTTIAYRDPLLRMTADIHLDPIEATASKLLGGLRFHGTGTLRGQPVVFNGDVAQLENAVEGGKFGLTAHAVAADTVIDVSGRIPGLTRIAQAPLHVAVRGTNMADLFGFIGATAVSTRRYHLAAQLIHSPGRWDFNQLSGVFGDSDLAGWLAIRMPAERMKIDANLTTRSLDMLDAGPFIGYDPKRLDALGAKGAITRVNGTPRVLPDAPLRVDAVSRFDADVRYRVDEIRGRFMPVSDVDVTLKLDHGLITLQPVSAVLAGGRLDGEAVLDARGAVVASDIGLHLEPTPMGRLFAGFGVDSGTTGTLGARVRLHGTGNSVRTALASSDGRIAVIIPQGTMWARNIQLAELDLGLYVQKLLEKKLKDPVEVNCGLLGFTVRSGLATADPVLIDTTKNVITARGGFSFRDESLDMDVRAKAKTFSLFSLQSPIGVGGHFAGPRINVISPQLLARGGAAVALGLVATPLAALLAFVDPGNAKAAACGPVLAGANAATQRTAKGQPRKDLGPLPGRKPQH